MFFIYLGPNTISPLPPLGDYTISWSQTALQKADPPTTGRGQLNRGQRNKLLEEVMIASTFVTFSPWLDVVWGSTSPVSRCYTQLRFLCFAEPDLPSYCSSEMSSWPGIAHGWAVPPEWSIFNCHFLDLCVERQCVDLPELTVGFVALEQAWSPWNLASNCI